MSQSETCNPETDADVRQEPEVGSDEAPSSDAENSESINQPEPNTMSSTKSGTERKLGIQLQTMNGDRLIPVGHTKWFIFDDSPTPEFSVSEDDLAETTSDNFNGCCGTGKGIFQDRRSVYLEHDEGQDKVNKYGLEKGPQFLIPWAYCETWKTMKEAIKETYGDNEKAKKMIDEGDFRLSVFQRNVLPQFWSSLVEPNMSIRIRLGSHDKAMKPDGLIAGSHTKPMVSVSPMIPLPPVIPPPPMVSKPRMPESSAEVIYRVECYVKPKWLSGPDEFLYSKDCDKPVPLEYKDDRAHENSVLEEVRTVKFQDNEKKEAYKQLEGSEAMPKLGKGDTLTTKLYIRSEPLLNVLRSTVKYSSCTRPPVDIDDYQPAPLGKRATADTDIFKEGAFAYPYPELFHHKAELIAYKEARSGPRSNHTDEYNRECDHHIDLLIEYLYNEPNIHLAKFEAGLAKRRPTVTFAGFWLLVRPGCDVYVMEENQLNAYVVDSVSGGIDYTSPFRWASMPSNYHVRVWNLVYDGKVIRRKSKGIQVRLFDNEQDITSLPVFPTKFHDTLDGGTRRQELIARGKQFFRYSKGPAYLEYTGVGLKPGWKKYNRARVVVEHESSPWELEEFGPTPYSHLSMGEIIGKGARRARCECAPCTNALTPTDEYMPVTFGDYDDIDPKKATELSEHQYLICGSHMYGFVLKDRAYDLLDVSGLDEPRIVTDAIDQLVMRPESNKVAIKAIVKTYADKISQNELFKADFIRGKGEGSIFLLHGPPGTGKTLTAESIAEFTRRPLLSITAADLGHEPDELEKNLLRFFKNAKLWDGIVLLDEADVYLERRSTNDLKRNSIVSVFLRALEYFQGTLFLTTNRVGHFDEAFLSRIHVSIGYEPLDNEARSQIWDGLFRKLSIDHKNGGPEILFEPEAKQYVQKDDVKALKWNGREIRNTFQTAVALAVFEAQSRKEQGGPEKDCVPLITEQQIAQVVRMSAAFKQYIRDTHGGLEEADLAMKLGNRDDKSKPNA